MSNFTTFISHILKCNGALSPSAIIGMLVCPIKSLSAASRIARGSVSAASFALSPVGKGAAGMNHRL